MIELESLSHGDRFILGVDEVGRGPLAGPVVTASTFVEFTPRENFSQASITTQTKNWLQYLDSLGICDSKKLATGKRQKILDAFPVSLKDIHIDQNYLLGERDGCRLWLRVAKCEPLEIDRLNILAASLEAMKKSSLGLVNDLMDDEMGQLGEVLVDGNRVFDVRPPTRALPLTKGDQRSLLIGLASIFAKEFRDLLMRNYALQYPQYGFKKHAGYPPKTHREAIRQWGPCEIHRRSFKGVREYC